MSRYTQTQKEELDEVPDDEELQQREEQEEQAELLGFEVSRGPACFI